MKNKIAVIGSGALGTALGKVLVDAKHEVIIYGIDETELNGLKKGINTKYFPNSINLPEFATTDNMQVALEDADYILIATPSVVVDKIIPSIIEHHKPGALIISGSKGFYPNSSLSLHEGINDKIKKIKSIKGIVSLIGPSHAEEIVLEAPTTVAAVDKNSKLCEEVQNLFNNQYFRVYIQTDVKGAEVGAAYKNVLAIASGMSTGLGYGINTTAALLTRGMAEMRRYNKCMKGKDSTLMGLTGFGDIIVTAMSDLSRNFTLGKNIATKGKDALKTKTTVEGVSALENIYKIAQEKNLDLPIIKFLYSVIFGKGKPEDFVKEI